MLRGAMYMMLLVSATAAADEVAQAWKDLFAQPEPVRAAAKIDAVLKACGNDAGTVRGLIAADRAYEAFEAGWHKRSLPVAMKDKTWPVEFHLRVPAGYHAHAGKSWPLLLLAHGQGSNGRAFGNLFERRLGRTIENFIVVSPTMPGEPLYSGRPYQEQAWLTPLAWARRSLDVDDDRIALTGYSQGGHHTWHLATMFPHLWASAVPMAGVPFFEGTPHVTGLYLPNLAALPLWAVWGENDRAKPPLVGNADLCREAADQLQRLPAPRFTFTELPGADHGHSWPPAAELAAYLAKHKRTLAPPTFTHAFHTPAHARAYYLEALEFSRTPADIGKPVRVTLAGPAQPTQDQLKAALRAAYQRDLFTLTATLDASANSLTLRAPGVRKVRLYLHDHLLDLSRPVTLRFGSSTWKGLIPISARCLLTGYAATRDATALLLNEIDLDASGKVVIRYSDKPPRR